MSETNALRTAAILAAADALEANPTVANRDALIAAVRASRNPRFFSVSDRLYLYRQGREIPVANFSSVAFAEAIRDRLNVDLDAGWIPGLS